MPSYGLYKEDIWTFPTIFNFVEIQKKGGPIALSRKAGSLKLFLIYTGAIRYGSMREKRMRSFFGIGDYAHLPAS